MLDGLLPKGSQRRKFAVKAYRTVTFKKATNPYERWAMENNDQLRLLNNPPLDKNPLISVIIPAYNTPQRYLLPCVYSVVGQSYQNWELIIIDASTDKQAQQRIETIAQADKRIKVFKMPNKGIAANTNAGLDKSQGEYIGFLDHDDLLTDDTLWEVANALNDNPDAGLLYSDEDKVSDDGSQYLAPHFKPDWSPDLLTHVNYITHFTVVKKSLADKVGGLDSDKDGSQDYDFVLKITDLKVPVIHIPKILYHWRVAKNSTAADVSNKPYIKKAGERALSDHYDRLKLKAEVKSLDTKPGFYETTIRSSVKPTIIITNFANPTSLDIYAGLLRKHLPKAADITLPSADQVGLKGKDFIKESLKNASEHAIFINDFVFPQLPSWPESLANLLELPHIHAASPIVYRNDKKIEDAGVISRGYTVQNLFENEKSAVNTYFGDTDWTRNVDFLSGRVVAIRRDELLKELGEIKGGTVADLLQAYSQKSDDKYNTILSTSPMLQLRSSSRRPKARFMNTNLSQVRSSLELVSSEQQVLDALLKMKKDLDG